MDGAGDRTKGLGCYTRRGGLWCDLAGALRSGGDARPASILNSRKACKTKACSDFEKDRKCSSKRRS